MRISKAEIEINLSTNYNKELAMKEFEAELKNEGNMNAMEMIRKLRKGQ